MPHIQVNEIEIFYTIKGDGPPLLFLHGNGEDHHTFDILIEKLSIHHRCYAVDSRNHGQSQQTNEFHYQTMMEDTKELINALQLAPINVIGFSDGAIITMLLAIPYQSLVNKIILL